MTATLVSVRPPWLRMWTQPRSTVREQIARGPTAAVWILPILSGIAQTLIRGAGNNVGLRAPAIAILAISIPIGALWGVVQLNLFAGLLALVERWTDGRGTFSELRVALSWAAVPQALLLVVWLLGTAVAGRYLYIEDPAAVGAPMPAFLAFGVANLAGLVCVIWWLVLMIAAVAEAQGASPWRAFGTLVLAGLMFGVAALLIIVVAIGVLHH